MCFRVEDFETFKVWPQTGCPQEVSLFFFLHDFRLSFNGFVYTHTHTTTSYVPFTWSPRNYDENSHNSDAFASFLTVNSMHNTKGINSNYFRICTVWRLLPGYFFQRILLESTLNEKKNFNPPLFASCTDTVKLLEAWRGVLSSTPPYK
jgi:hypothetical protein